MNYSDYNDWPEMKISLTPGYYLYCSNGTLAGFMNKDGKIQWEPNMENSDIESWNNFGIINPSEIIDMNNKINELIQKLADNQ